MKTGILNRATEAKEKTEEAKSKETETLSNYEDVLEEYANPEIKLMKLIVNSGDSMEVTLPIKPNSENNYTIDWGDGTKEKVDPMAYATHTYSSASTEYTVTIDGTVKEIDASDVSDSDSIVKVAQWGELGLTKVNFAWCGNLVEIASPTKNSFKDVTDFSSAFAQTEITSIPENLFANCPKVTNFSWAFLRTEITSIPKGLFDNCMKVESFVSTFYACAELKGLAIELWTRGTNSGLNDYQGTPNGWGCFYGCEQLDNYDQIPAYWVKNNVPE